MPSDGSYEIRGRYTGVILGAAGQVTEEEAAHIRGHLEAVFPGNVIFAVAPGTQSMTFQVELPDGAYIQRHRNDR